MRSVLVVLSLLALVAQPAEAGQKSKAARQKKAATLKKAGAGKQKQVKPTGESTAHQGAGTLGGTRLAHQDASHGLPRSEAIVASSGSRSSSRTVARKRAQPRNATITTHQRESTVVPTASTAMAQSFDASAAIAPKKKSGRVKRWFAGLFLVAALAGGGYGWHAADMNSKVGDAWSYVTHVISDATHGGGGGGGHTTPIPPVPDNPQPPFPDPGPPTPPDNSTPGPSGGHGHQTPHHPETDHRGR